ncbi:MAG: diacylglycerol kinase family protein [Pedobacter sp.]|nr:MAG: diacylglycerol kinase family protein [Pedobacter sp.]
MKRFLSSFGFAFKGLAYAFKTQLNFRVHCIALILVVVLGLFFKLDRSEWLWIVIAVVMVFSAELINTALEVLVDLVSPQQHPKAGAIKDLAAGAVLITAVGALIIGLFIFVPKLF